MRFVKVRSVTSQAALMHHKVREKLIGQRTQLLNSLRGHLSEFGIIDGLGRPHALASKVREGHADIPEIVRAALLPLVAQLDCLDTAISAAHAAIARLAKADDVACRLMTIPGIGPLTASALVSVIDEPAWHPDESTSPAQQPAGQTWRRRIEMAVPSPTGHICCFEM